MTLERQLGILLADARRMPAQVPEPPPRMSQAERRDVVDAFLTVIGGVYAHLPLKRARYGIDPVQQLRLLRDRVGQLRDPDFHAELAAIVTGLRDAHSRYASTLGGAAGQVAALPFLAESFGPASAPTYVVSKTGPQELIGDPGLVRGVELLSWNGIAFDRAVDRHADDETGGRADARRARALLSLTFRSLAHGPPPDEDWVIVGYRDAGGTAREVRLDWRVISPGTAPDQAIGTGAAGAEALAWAVDPAAEVVRRARQLMFAPTVWQATTVGRSPRVAQDAGDLEGALPPGSVPSTLPDVLNARAVDTPAGPIAYLRIFSFVAPHQAFVDEVARLLDLLPQRGLIVDIRNNPGGQVWAAERTLQLLTPATIEPCRFSWFASDVTRALVARGGGMPGGAGLEAWAPSLAAAVSSGEAYSQGLPLTPPELCNDVGQRYGGPVVCVADANTYSSGDLFAAGFVDNGVGSLITVGAATGAGGANVWSSAEVRAALVGTTYTLPELPDGVEFTVAVRRFTRVGAATGIPVEDLGVPGSTTYVMTARDLVEDNRDLIDRCAERLAGLPWGGLRVAVRPTGPGDERVIVVDVAGLDIVDVFVDGHPWTAVEVTGRTGEVRVRRRLTDRANRVEVVGWTGSTITQRRRLEL